MQMRKEKQKKLCARQESFPRSENGSDLFPGEWRNAGNVSWLNAVAHANTPARSYSCTNSLSVALLRSHLNKHFGLHVVVRSHRRSILIFGSWSFLQVIFFFIVSAYHPFLILTEELQVFI